MIYFPTSFLFFFVFVEFFGEKVCCLLVNLPLTINVMWRNVMPLVVFDKDTTAWINVFTAHFHVQHKVES